LPATKLRAIIRSATRSFTTPHGKVAFPQS